MIEHMKSVSLHWEYCMVLMVTLDNEAKNSPEKIDENDKGEKVASLTDS